MNRTCAIIIFYSLVFVFIYGLSLFVFWTFFRIASSEVEKVVLYVAPAGILMGIALFLVVFSFFSKILFIVFYWVLGLYIGIIVYMFFSGIIYHIIAAFVDLSLLSGLIIELGLSMIISILGVIFGRVIFVKRVNLTYPGFKGKTTICHLSDIHLGAINQKGWLEKIMAKVRDLNPDVIVITGDLADGSCKIDSDWLSPLNKTTTPILFITGNHESIYGTQEFFDLLQTTNVKLIGKERINFEVNNVNFIGIDFESNLKEKLIEAQALVKSDKPNVLIHHIPQLKPCELDKYNIFLYLCGHTHSGQIFPLQIPAYFG